MAALVDGFKLADATRIAGPVMLIIIHIANTDKPSIKPIALVALVLNRFIFIYLS